MSTIAVSFEVLNTKNTPSIAADVAANRPATAATGALYISTDTNTLERWNGSAWVAIGGGGGGIGGSGTINTIPIFTAATDIGDSSITYTPGAIGVAPSYSLGSNRVLTLPFTSAAAQPIGLYIYEAVATGFNFQRVVGAPSYNSIYSGNSKLEFKLFDGATDYYHTFFSNGRIAINGITDTGYQFRVNGTSSFVGNTSIQGTIGATDTIQTAGGGISVAMSYSASTGILGTSSNHALDIRTNNVNSVRVVNGTNRVLINTTTDSGYQLRCNGTALFDGRITFGGDIFPQNSAQSIGNTTNTINSIYVGSIYAGANSSATFTLRRNNGDIVGAVFQTSGNFMICAGNNNTTEISTVAALQLNNTTKGVLINRLTTAQRTAIASPPNGLMVFDTDLSHICFYDTSGTPGWRKLSYSNA